MPEEDILPVITLAALSLGRLWLAYFPRAFDQQTQRGIGRSALEGNDADRPHLSRHFDRQDFHRQSLGAEMEHGRGEEAQETS